MQPSLWCSARSSLRCQDVPGLSRPSRRYDAGRDGFIDLMELKLMMEKLGAPQTHLGLKNMIKEVDEDFDSKLSFREVSLLPTWTTGGLVLDRWMARSWLRDAPVGILERPPWGS